MVLTVLYVVYRWFAARVLCALQETGRSVFDVAFLFLAHELELRVVEVPFARAHVWRSTVRLFRGEVEMFVFPSSIAKCSGDVRTIPAVRPDE